MQVELWRDGLYLGAGDVTGDTEFVGWQHADKPLPKAGDVLELRVRDQGSLLGLYEVKGVRGEPKYLLLAISKNSKPKPR